jgi:ribosomal protein S27E
MLKQPSGVVRLGSDELTARCSICGTTLGHIEEQNGYTALIEGYFLHRGADPHYAPSKRLVARHRKLKRDSWRSGDEAGVARSKLNSGVMGGESRILGHDGKPIPVYSATNGAGDAGGKPKFVRVHEMAKESRSVTCVYFGSTIPVICVHCGARLAPLRLK